VAFVADIRLRVVGLDEAIRASQASVSICVLCADLMAKGDEPPMRTQPLNHLVYTQVHEMISSDPTFALMSWIEMRKLAGLGGPTMHDPKVLQAWGNLRKALAIPALISAPEREEKGLQAAG